MNRFYRVHPAFACLIIVGALLATVAPAKGAEVVIRNDTLANMGAGAIQAGFDPGESAAAWLTSTCTGTIVAVQILWRSQSGGEPPTLEQSITVFGNGTFPVPGPVLAFLEGPVLTDGFLNEYRYLDELQTIPLSIPINTGERFVVSFEFANDPDPSNGPSVVTDTGCQGQKNAINAIGLGWVNSCSLGVSGDFVIRAVVDCGAVQGACCSPAGGCTGPTTQAQCTQSGGTWQGAGTTCGTVNCPILVGACCKTDQSCEDVLTNSECTTLGGTYQGDGSECASVNCPLLEGACCKPDGSCVDGVTSGECGSMSGTYQGNGTTCALINCPPPPQACCNPISGFCGMTDPDQCTGFGGVPQGPGSACVGPSANQCPTGACCLPSGACNPSMTPAQCAAAGGAYQGTGVTCGQVSCPQPQGACCLTSGGCTISGQSLCEGFGNFWAGIGTDCVDTNANTQADACENCPGSPDGNMNGDLATNGRDISIFVNAVMGQSQDPTDLCRGDFSFSFVMDPDDIPGMVGALLGN